MEQNGVLVNQELARSEIQMGNEIMGNITESLNGLKPTSPKDLQELLIERLELPVVKRSKKTNKPSFDKYAMEEYEAILSNKQDTTAQRILEYRGWQKAVSTYFTSFIEKAHGDGRIRPNFKLHGTRTSRLACEKPNFQQIPKTTDERKRWNLNTKKCIVPTPGWRLWEADYGNLELRLAAVYSDQQNLIDAFNRGDKIWEVMKGDLGWDDKNRVKTFTYSVLFGAGVKRIMNAFGVSRSEAVKLIKEFYAPYPRLKWTIGQVNDGAEQQGYITYWTGRRRHFPATESSHKAFNSLMQGGGAEIVKRALIEIFETVCDEFCRLVLTVHDSIVLEIREGYEHIYLPRIQSIMERIPTNFFGMTFTVDVHEWGMAA
jgi:DNA polymerase-1